MPTQKTSTTKQEKPDNRQVLLDLIGKEYGPSSVVVMERALKNQDKQIDAAMHTHGMSLEDIAGSRGWDLAKIGAVNPQSTPEQGQPNEGKQVLNELVNKKKGNFWYTPYQMDRQSGEVTPASILGGLISQSPSSVLQMTQAQTLGQKNNATKGVYGFDPSKGTVTQMGEIPATAELRNMEQSSGLAELDPEQQVLAYGLAREIGGVRGAKNVLPSVVQSLKSGRSIEETRDQLRYMEQSPGFNKDIRNAAQQIMVGESKDKANTTFDYLDDLVQSGDTEGVKSFLKKSAIKQSPVDQQNRVMGKERTVEFLGEIENDLSMLEKAGMPTGFFSGNLENLMAKVGQVKNPQMREVATKIATAVMNYRRDMTGVAFGKEEGQEYKTIFPSINKVGKFNIANITALKKVFSGDLDKFYSISMGDKNYKKLYGGDKGKYTRTGKDKQGRRVGQLADGTIEVINE